MIMVRWADVELVHHLRQQFGVALRARFVRWCGDCREATLVFVEVVMEGK